MRPRHFLAALFFAALLYPLSIGPVGLLFSRLDPARQPAFDKAAEAVYWPLERLYDNVPAVHGFADWYMKLWGAG